ncbi:MAG TPA: LON peptidase substrate-binding domain-containing protein [Pirellulales bacterium]|nr:LON peptidase substrate-binding domain-containing protein [Pirellulales bacterium]
MPSDEFSFSADTFSGTARLFPLPNLVMFPHVMQPLHIFEPRYRAMLEEALAGDRLFALCLLSPGWETDYEGRPPVHPVACLCRVATHHVTEQGTYNVLVWGLRRIKIVRELPPTKLFREAEVTLLDDVYPEENASRRGALQRRLVAAFRKVLPKLPVAQSQLEPFLTDQINLGMLTDIVTYTSNLDQKIKTELLAQPLPDLRALLLLECLTGGKKGSPLCNRDFPPAFSSN